MKKSESPSRPSEPRTGDGAARERTLAHMENLMRTATTTVGTGLLLACAAQAQKPRPPEVCDELPPPPRMSCDAGQFLSRGCIKPSAGWVNSGGQWSLRLALEAPNLSPVSFAGTIWGGAPGKSTHFEVRKDDAKLTGASLKELAVHEMILVVVLAPAADAKQAILEFPVLFNNQKVALKLSLDIGEPPSEKGSVPVKQIK